MDINPQIRTLESAKEIYHKQRNKYSLNKRIQRFGRYEGMKFFRFGNSWRRLSHDREREIVLFDGSNKWIEENWFTRTFINGMISHLIGR